MHDHYHYLIILFLLFASDVAYLKKTITAIALMQINPVENQFHF